MKFTKTLIASAVIVATSTLAFAAQTDQTTMTINVTKSPFAVLTGFMKTSGTKDLALADVDGSTGTLIGDLGVDSNINSDCTVSFTSTNDFKLKHDTLTEYLHGATGQYTLGWKANTIQSGATNVIDIVGCNTVATDVTIDTPALAANLTAGDYSDTITMTVTTP